MENTEQTIKIINAIGAQWPFLITVFVIVVIIFKWKSIWNGIGKFNRIKVKKGDTEVELNSKENKTEGKTVPTIESTSKPAENIDNEKSKESTLFDCYLKLSEEKNEEAQKVFEQVQASADEPDKFLNEIVYTYYKFLHGNIPSIEKLLEYYREEKLSNSNRYNVCIYLGYCYLNSSNSELALKYFEESESLAIDDNQKTTCATNIADIYSRDELFEKAILKLISISSEISDKRSLANIYKSLSKIYKERGNSDLRIAFLEKAVEIFPNDTATLFDLAYDYSNSNYNDASIIKYLNLLSFKPNHSMALNNIGYGFSKEEMQFNAVKYYKKAIEIANTLAVGNLSFKFINEGFHQEAEELIERFKNEKDVDQMVVRAQDEILNAKKKEDTSMENLKKSGKKKSEFFRQYSDGILSIPSLNSYSSEEWTDENNNNISVSISSGELNVSWTSFNKAMGDNDVFEIKGKFDINGCSIIYKNPETLPNIFSNKLEGKKESIRSIKEYHGQCSINIPKGVIIMLYKRNEIINFKTITKKPSA